MISRFASVLFLGNLVLAPLVTFPAHAQGAESLPKVQKLYVDTFGNGKGAAEMRKRTVKRLVHSKRVQIVMSRNDADAVLKGTGQIWTTGHIALSARSHSLDETTYQGFLSAEIIGKNNQTLWSYLVTPSKFSWGSIMEDLPRQLANRLLADMRETGHTEELAAPGTAGAGTATLRGAGATFPSPLYRKWFEVFGKGHPEVKIAYDAVGSGEGIQRLKQGTVDFAASEMPLADEAVREARLATQIPMVLGAVVPIYNLKLRRINFTAEVLAGIYLGKIKRWNDPQIRTANPGASLPDAEIKVVHRADGSGTTFVWTDYLSKVSPEWKTTVGSGITVDWPVGEAAAYNDGVASTVERTPNALGYVELIYAIQHELNFGTVRNSSGEFIRADIESVTAAARSGSSPDRDLRVSLTNAPGKGAYPISTYTWLLLSETAANNKGPALLGLVRWMLTSGQKSCSALGYVPLPAEVSRRALEAAGQALGRGTRTGGRAGGGREMSVILVSSTTAHPLPA